VGLRVTAAPRPTAGPDDAASTRLLSVSGLSVEYRTGDEASQRLVAVSNVSFEVGAGEVFGVIGESGSGKTSLGRAIAGLEPIAHGTATLQGAALASGVRRRPRRQRGAIQMVFQNPQSALDPRMTAIQSVAETLRARRPRPQAAERRRVAQTYLARVGIGAELADRYPHELSGGQKQRVNIARSLCLEPRLVVADEPVSALDVSVQAEIVTLLAELRRQLSLSFLFISHDLAVVAQLADRVGVMYFGRFVEIAPTAALIAAPVHPYTRGLLAASPSARRRGGLRRGTADLLVRGEMPDRFAQPVGCAFASRCPHAEPACEESQPELRAVGGSTVACHRAEQILDITGRSSGPTSRTDPVDRVRETTTNQQGDP